MDSFPLTLITRVTQPLAGWWWVGPLVMAFTWILVPVMRQRHNVLGSDDYSGAARFWWQPGWGFLGLVGLGLAMIDAPLLRPEIAERWAPGAWFGLTVDWELQNLGIAVGGGILMGLLGIKLYILARLRDRRFRYQAWRWREGMRRAPRDEDEE